MPNTHILYGTSDKEVLINSLTSAFQAPDNVVGKVIVVTNETDPVKLKIIQAFFDGGCCGGSEKPQKPSQLFVLAEKSNVFVEAVRIAKKEDGVVLLSSIDLSFSQDHLNEINRIFKDKNVGAIYSSEITDGRLRYNPSFSPSIKYDIQLQHVAVRSALLSGNENRPFEVVINAFKSSVVMKLPEYYAIKQ